MEARRRQPGAGEVPLKVPASVCYHAPPQGTFERCGDASWALPVSSDDPGQARTELGNPSELSSFQAGSASSLPISSCHLFQILSTFCMTPHAIAVFSNGPNQNPSNGVVGLLRDAQGTLPEPGMGRMQGWRSRTVHEAQTRKVNSN